MAKNEKPVKKPSKPKSLDDKSLEQIAGGSSSANSGTNPLYKA